MAEGKKSGMRFLAGCTPTERTLIALLALICIATVALPIVRR
jgi:hypothetical protein